ncbi:MAG: tetratricopeptide repeat protein [Vicinamibacterales bacterium]
MAEATDSTLIHRETRALVLLLAIAVAAFVLTRTVAHANDARRQRDAQAWFSRGTAALARGETTLAAQQLRRASLLEPPNLPIRLALATALTAANAVGEARAVLLEARTAAPQNADVNLALGRLEADHGDAAATISAYQSALNSLWHPGDAVARYQVRIELARYLLAQDQRSRSLSELLIVAADVPDTAAAHADVGQLLLAAGEPSRALLQLQRSLALNQADETVQFAAGRAALAAGDDSRALRHLRAAAELAPARHLATVITLVLAHDPLLPRLPSAERERRLRVGLAQVRTRLAGCPAGAGPRVDTSGLAGEVDSFEASLASKRKRRTIPVVDLVDDGVELMARVEALTVACGPAQPLDQALSLIGRRHEARS